MRRPVLVAALAVATALVAGPAAVAQTTTTAPVATTTTLPTNALTRSTISVGGVVDTASADAVLGAQARFERANTRGGVAGRQIVYVGTSPDAKTAIAGVVPISAVVPAASATLDTATLATAKLPFFGPANEAAWTGNTSGFGFAGAQVPADTARTASPAWGITMKSLLGGAKGKRIAVASVSGDATSEALSRSAAASLRAAGFSVLPTSLPVAGDPAAAASGLAQTGPDGVVLLVDVATTSALASALAAQSYTGTVATTQAFYRPENPAVAAGLTVMLPYAPPEQATAANKLLAADVEKFAPGTKLTANVIAGYWAADEFVAALTKTGKGVTAAKLAKTLRTFTYTVKGTVGPTVFPAAHAQPSTCGALVQSDGTAYLPVVTYRCGTPVKVKSVAPPPTTAAK